MIIKGHYDIITEACSPRLQERIDVHLAAREHERFNEDYIFEDGHCAEVHQHNVKTIYRRAGVVR